MATDHELVDLQETIYSSSNPTRRWLHCTRRDWINDAIERSAASGAERALEVGPGSGIYLPTLARHFAQVVASDIETAYLEYDRTHLADLPNLSFKIDDITTTEFDEASFDLILCTEVIEHIVDSQAAIDNMWHLLKPGGVLILSTPQRYSPLEMTAKIAFLPGIIQIVRLIYNEPVLETGHINLMTANEVVRQLQGPGFEILESHKSGLYLPLVAEFLGETGLKLEKWLEARILGGALDGLIWTQYYIARKPQ